MIYHGYGWKDFVIVCKKNQKKPLYSMCHFTIATNLIRENSNKREHADKKFLRRLWCDLTISEYFPTKNAVLSYKINNIQKEQPAPCMIIRFAIDMISLW